MSMRRPGADDPDWAKLYLQATLQAPLVAYYIQMLKAVTEQWEEVETEGREAMLWLSMMVQRRGGRVKLHRHEFEPIREKWLQKRVHDGGDTVEFRLLDRPPPGHRD